MAVCRRRCPEDRGWGDLMSISLADCYPGQQFHGTIRSSGLATLVAAQNFPEGLRLAPATKLEGFGPSVTPAYLYIL